MGLGGFPIHLAASRLQRQRQPGFGVGHGQRLQEVVDLVGWHLERERVAVNAGFALVVGDAVAVDDDATERGGVGFDVAGVLRAGAGEQRDEGDGG